jgi:DNA sulfur modification protein DndB
MATDLDYKFSFPAIRGIQAKREYYLIMCPLRLIPRLFVFDEEGEIPPEMRAQRVLNRARVPEIARYVIENPYGYIFSAITASIDGEVHFEPISEKGAARNLGTLVVPMKARFIVNDGQHRRAALEEALKQRPELADETISVVLFVDTGLKRSQQMFADLNKHAVRPTKSLGILYDHRDPMATLARNLIDRVSVFKGMTDTEKTSISNRSIKLFTLSSIYQATQALLRKSKKDAVSSEDEALSFEFWTEVGKHIPEWNLAMERRVSSAELRQSYIHAHGVALQALGIAGSDLLRRHPRDWKAKLKALKKVDWSRSNTTLWEGRAMHGGKVSKAHDSIMLTANVLKERLGIPLSKEEERLEKEYQKRRRS